MVELYERMCGWEMERDGGQTVETIAYYAYIVYIRRILCIRMFALATFGVAWSCYLTCYDAS